MEYRYNVITTAWENVSDLAKDMVRKLLVNKEERWTAEQALAHPWLSTTTQGRVDIYIVASYHIRRNELWIVHWWAFVLVRHPLTYPVD
jgi:serine/threonine protein kinase